MQSERDRDSHCRLARRTQLKEGARRGTHVGPEPRTTACANDHEHAACLVKVEDIVCEGNHLKKFAAQLL